MKMMNTNSSAHQQIKQEVLWKIVYPNLQQLNIEWSVLFPDSQIQFVQKQGDNSSNDAVRKDQYKYAGETKTSSMPMFTKSIELQNHLVVLYG